MNTHFENSIAKTFVILFFILLTFCTVIKRDPQDESVPTASLISQNNSISQRGPYLCPKQMSKLCETYNVIQNNYIKRIPDDELTDIFIRGATGKIRETDPSKAGALNIQSSSFICSPNMQKLCDAYDTIQNNYGKRISDKYLTEAFINGAIAIMNETDPYSKYASSVEENVDYFEYSGIGLDMKKEETFPFSMIVRVAKEYNPAYLAGIRRGDKITHVDGISVTYKTARETINLIRGKQGTRVYLTVVSGCSGIVKNIVLVRQNTRDILSGAVKVLDGQYGYIRLAEFNPGTMIKIRTSIEQVQKTHGQMKGLILDLRNNPGGLVLEAKKLTGIFTDKGPVLYERSQNGKYTAWEIPEKSADILYGKPIIVLVNKDTASAAEITAGALQDLGRATILGTQTYGKGCLQTKFYLRDKSILDLTRASTYTPKKNAINKVGISPDVYVKEGTNESCTGDEQLAQALKILNERGK